MNKILNGYRNLATIFHITKLSNRLKMSGWHSKTECGATNNFIILLEQFCK